MTPTKRKDPACSGLLTARQSPPKDNEFRVYRFCGQRQEHPTHAYYECSADRLQVVTLRAALLADAAVAWDRF